MDVRCERCQTEYEFDEARVTEAGVAVKCTQCGHVFKVRKPAAAAQPGEADPLPAPPPSAPAPEPPREWRVRQASGKVLAFRELTTLQRWIIERKVSREDEITLTGDAWKPLGGIPDLGPFFQVVEDAQRTSEVAQVQSSGLLGLTGAGGLDSVNVEEAPPAGAATLVPVITAAAPVAPQAPAEVVAFPPAPTIVSAPTPAPPAPQPVAAPAPAAATAPPAPQPVVAPAPSINVTVHTGAPASPNAPAPAEAPRPPGPTAPAPAGFAMGQRVQPRSGVSGWLVALLLLAVFGGGGYYGYTSYWLPEQERRAAEALRAAQERARVAKLQAERDRAARELEEEERRAREEAEAAAAAEAAAKAEAVLARAKEPVRDFNWYMNQGDRQRLRERAEAALDAYGKAHDLQPDRAEPIAGRGLAMLDLGNPLPAEAALEQALRLNPRYGPALMGMAEALRIQGRDEEAIRFYKRFLEVAPPGSEAKAAEGAIKRLER